MEFFNWLNSSSEPSYFSAQRRRNWEANVLREHDSGSKFSGYLFPYVEGLLSKGKVKGPPHFEHLKTNRPIHERANNNGPMDKQGKPIKSVRSRKKKIIKTRFKKVVKVLLRRILGQRSFFCCVGFAWCVNKCF